MSNFTNFMEGLPLELKRPLCALTLEQVQAQPNPLSLLTEFPYESQWLDGEAWTWLEYELALQMGNCYAKTGKHDSFTRQTARDIAKGN